MQLTPRTLTLALGACLAGGLVLGVASVIGPAVSASSAAPEPTATVANFPQTELGDTEISFPSPTSSPSERPAAASLPPSPNTGWSPSPVNSPATLGDPNRFSSPAATATATPAPIVTPEATALETTRITPKVEHPLKPEEGSSNPGPATWSTPAPLAGWHPPRLGVGETNIAAPKLSSGGRADVTVMCTPSAACSAAGSFVTITPEASMVSVTWSAPARNNWRSWAVSRSYKAPPAG
jgi:hypothetical protein